MLDDTTHIHISGYLYIFWYTRSVLSVQHIVSIVKIQLRYCFYCSHDFKVIMLRQVEGKSKKDRLYKIKQYNASSIEDPLKGGISKAIKERTWSSQELQAYILVKLDNMQYQFIAYVSDKPVINDNNLYLQIPLDILINRNINISVMSAITILKRVQYQIMYL